MDIINEIKINHLHSYIIITKKTPSTDLVDDNDEEKSGSIVILVIVYMI